VAAGERWASVSHLLELRSLLFELRFELRDLFIPKAQVLSHELRAGKGFVHFLINGQIGDQEGS
jgi:hypothetical protein